MPGARPERKVTSVEMLSAHRPAAQQPLWPERLHVLAVALTCPASPEERTRWRSELWPLLYGSLCRYVRLHASRYGTIDPDLVHDVASEKAIDLLSRLDRGAWDPRRWTPGQLAAFVSRIARNGLIDLIRARLKVRDGGSLPSLARRAARASTGATEHGLERRLFAAALRDCAGLLQKRARTVWLLRVFLEMPSADIGRHPGVRLSVPAVDMMLMRCRRTIRRCMRRKGFEPEDMPPGVFAVLWKAFGFDSQLERGE